MGELCSFKKQVSPKSDHVALSCNVYRSQDNFIYHENARLTYIFCTTGFIALSQFFKTFHSLTIVGPRCSCLLLEGVILGSHFNLFPGEPNTEVTLTLECRLSSILIETIASLERCVKPAVSKFLRLKSQFNCQFEQALILYEKNLAKSRSADELLKLFRLLRCCKMLPLIQYTEYEVKTDIEKSTFFNEVFQSVVF